MRKRTEDVKRGLKPLQIKFFSLLGHEPPKPIHPKLVLIFGYPLSAMISQLLFWRGMEKRKDGFIFKTEKEFIDELGLSSAQQKLAIKKGKSFGFLRVVRKGIPAKRHYLLDYELLVEKAISEADRKRIALSKNYHKLVQKNLQNTVHKNPSNTDNTTETTARYHSTESAKDILSRRFKRR